MLSKFSKYTFGAGFLALIGLLSGCGSGSGTGEHSNLGRVQLRISWPDKNATKSAKTRYIPPYAQSLFFELYLKTDPTKRYKLTANRPSDKPSTQTVSFTQLLNEGTYVLAGAARVLADGGGATVASAAKEVVVVAGTNGVDLTLATTIKTISILGQPITVQVGPDVTMLSGAVDPDGRTLLLPNGALQWSVVSGSAFGTITSAGVLSPKAVGTVRIKLLEPGANISDRKSVV